MSAKNIILDLQLNLKGFLESIERALASLGQPGEDESESEIARSIKDVSSWDGSASNYADTNEYCAACLIDLNEGSGDKKQNLCKLPVRGPGDGQGVYVRQAVHAAAAAIGGARSAMKAPEGVDSAAWGSAFKRAAKKVIALYKQMKEDAPAGCYKAAGMEAPKKNSLTRAIADLAQLKGGLVSTEPKARSLAFGQLFQQVYSMIEDACMGMGYEGRSQYGYLSDIYRANDGSLYAIFVVDGHLYKADLVLSDSGVELPDPSQWTEVVSEHMPAQSTQTQTRIVREKSGRYRWLSRSCTAVLNRVGEIDSRKLFDSFIAHAQETGEYPYRTIYHLGEKFRTGQADFLTRDGYVYITSGLYDESELAQAEIKARMEKPDYWGESIQYTPTEPPELIKARATDGSEEVINIPVFTAGINTEISTLRESDAASEFTNSIPMEVNRMADKRIMAALAELVGEELAKKFEGELDETNRSAAAMIARAKPDLAQYGGAGGQPADPPAAASASITEAAPAPAGTQAAPPTQREDTSAAPDKPELVIDDSVLDEIADRVIAKSGLGDLKSTLEKFDQRLGDMSRQMSADTQKRESALAAIEDRIVAVEDVQEAAGEIARQDAPARPRTIVTYRRSQSTAPITQARGNGAGQDDSQDVPEESYESIAESTLANLK